MVWITYNGEIYNFLDLRKELESRGHKFKTNSDTEVIIHGYEEWEEDVVGRLRGMFAFAILDLRKRIIFLVRDRMGIKPLIYYYDRNKFIFASEIKAIIKDYDVAREIDYKALNDYFDYGYVPAPRTMFKNICKLKPGHYLKIGLSDRTDFKQVKYWNLKYESRKKLGEEDVINSLIDLIKESVRIRLISDVPLGAFLSGGMDSSTIVRLMTDVAVEKINTFSIGFNEEKFSEIKYARIIADSIGSNHLEHIVAADIRELLPKLVYHFDEPFSDSSAIPTYYVAKMARQNVTVSLSGEGGDELFGGYKRYSHCMRMSVFDFLPSWFRSIFFGGLSYIYPERLKGGMFIHGLGLSPNDRFLNFMKNQYGYVKKDEIFENDVLENIIIEYSDQAYLKNSFNNSISDPLTRYLDLDLKTYLPNDILTKTDITSMMNSLEVRVPFLDHKLVEFVATLPSNYKLRNGVSKYILKKAMCNLLPEDILTRKKMGFGVPIRSWLANQLKDITHQYLLDKSRLSGLLDHNYLKKMVLDNERNIYQSSTGGKLWWILFFEMWYQDIFRKYL